MSYTETVSGKINELKLGESGQAVVGGEKAMPFCSFDGEVPNKPLIAMEVRDVAPTDWSEPLAKHFSDVWEDPAKWAAKCEKEFGADLICLVLEGIDPSGEDRTPQQAADTVKAVLGAISVPLIVYGIENAAKDAEVLKEVAAAGQGKNMLIGPALEDNYKAVVASALGFNHAVSGLTPVDVNMAKQLNILITQVGIGGDRITIDPTSGALGYGMEYCYSVMERLRIAGLTQGDTVTQMPIINNIGGDVWKIKECRVSEEEEPSWGDQEKRGIMWESLTATAYLMSGSNILVMRHPESVSLVKKLIDSMS